MRRSGRTSVLLTSRAAKAPQGAPGLRSSCERETREVSRGLPQKASRKTLVSRAVSPRGPVPSGVATAGAVDCRAQAEVGVGVGRRTRLFV